MDLAIRLRLADFGATSQCCFNGKWVRFLYLVFVKIGVKCLILKFLIAIGDWVRFDFLGGVR